jgi:F-type H+-transporting ATPase subunit b
MNFLDIQIGPILWTILNFIILLVLLRAVAWKPILKALRDRESSINDALDRAEVARKDAERVLAENEIALRRADEEAQKLLREGREYAERVRTDAVAKAQEENKRMLDAARAEIERSKQQALTEMREETASLAVKGAEKILRETLNDDRQKRLIDDYLSQALETQG